MNVAHDQVIPGRVRIAGEPTLGLDLDAGYLISIAAAAGAAQPGAEGEERFGVDCFAQPDTGWVANHGAKSLVENVAAEQAVAMSAEDASTVEIQSHRTTACGSAVTPM